MPKDHRPTSIVGIKRTAKEISKREGISHTKALNEAAKLAGFQNFVHARKAFSASVQPTGPRSEYPAPALSAAGGMLTGLISRILGSKLDGNRPRSFVVSKQRALAFVGVLPMLLAAIAIAATPFPNSHQIHVAESPDQSALQMQKSASLDGRQYNGFQNGDQKQLRLAQITTLAADERSVSARLLRNGELDDA